MKLPLPHGKKTLRVGPLFTQFTLRQPEFPPKRGHIGFERMASPISKTLLLEAGPVLIHFSILRRR